MMRYEGKIYRPPSEADAWILQATVGCSWNACTYCDMYREKSFRVRELKESLEDIQVAAAQFGDSVRKVFVADGDALAMDEDHWLQILAACREAFPRLRRVSAYATARNLLEKEDALLARLQRAGLTQLYIGPESGDDETMRKIAKGAGFEEHAEAAGRAQRADIKLSAIFLLGAGGLERSEPHARASGRLASAMDPKFLSALTLTIVPGTPIAKQEERGKFTLPDVPGLLRELRWFIEEAKPSDAIFRTNHASNYLPLAGRLPRDRDRLLATLDAALEGKVPLVPEGWRGL
jgi:radical SAM superfamily enzyme YgiQ (UPF0313 family)